MYQISSESPKFCRMYYEKHFGLSFPGHSVVIMYQQCFLCCSVKLCTTTTTLLPLPLPLQPPLLLLLQQLLLLDCSTPTDQQKWSSSCSWVDTCYVDCWLEKAAANDISDIRPLTHAAETVTLNSMPDSCFSFSCRCTTSNVIDCLHDLKAVYDVISRALARKKLAPESGVEFRPMAPVSGACVRGSSIECCWVKILMRFVDTHVRHLSLCGHVACVDGKANAYCCRIGVDPFPGRLLHLAINHLSSWHRAAWG